MTHGAETDWSTSLPEHLSQVCPLGFKIIQSGARSGIWNSFIERYHYLGYKPLPDVQMLYLVRSAHGESLALFGFGVAAWKTAPCDEFIDWLKQCR